MANVDIWYDSDARTWEFGSYGHLIHLTDLAPGSMGPQWKEDADTRSPENGETDKMHTGPSQ